MTRHGLATLCLTIFVLSAPAADPVAVRELRIQKVGDVTYFHILLAATSKIPATDRDNEPPPSEQPSSEARLVSPDGKAQRIYLRRVVPVIERSPESKDEKKPRDPVPVEGLEFI